MFYVSYLLQLEITADKIVYELNEEILIRLYVTLYYLAILACLNCICKYDFFMISLCFS